MVCFVLWTNRTALALDCRCAGSRVMFGARGCSLRLCLFQSGLCFLRRGPCVRPKFRSDQLFQQRWGNPVRCGWAIFVWLLIEVVDAHHFFHVKISQAPSREQLVARVTVQVLNNAVRRVEFLTKIKLRYVQKGRSLLLLGGIFVVFVFLLSVESGGKLLAYCRILRRDHI